MTASHPEQTQDPLISLPRQYGGSLPKLHDDVALDGTDSLHHVVTDARKAIAFGLAVTAVTLGTVAVSYLINE